MRDRFLKIWFPGLLATLLAFMGQMILFSGMYGRSVVRLGDSFMFISMPWLVLLVGCGGLGAFSCYREGGTPRQRLLAGTLPCVVNLVAFLLGIFASLTTDTVTPFAQQITAAFGFLVWAVALPAIALVIGTVPFVAVEQLQRHAPANA